MISTEFSFERFVEAVKGKDHLEIVQLAEREATDAWRSVYRCEDASDICLRSRMYQNRLLHLIDCIRHASLNLAANGRAADWADGSDGCLPGGSV